MTLSTLDKRVGQLYASQAKRARQAGARLEFDLAGLRRFVSDELSADCPRCPYCWKILHEGFFEIDHQIAVSRGGRWAITNLELICPTCNKCKGKLNANEFAELMALLRTWNPVAGHDVLVRLKAGWRKGWRVG